MAKKAQSVVFNIYEFEKSEEKPKTILKEANDFIDKHKVILGLFVTIGTLVISACFYLYRQGCLSFYNVGHAWNDYANKSLFYTLALPFCFIVAFILFVLYQLLPIIKKASFINRLLFWAISTGVLYLDLFVCWYMAETIVLFAAFFIVPAFAFILQSNIIEQTKCKKQKCCLKKGIKIFSVLLILGLMIWSYVSLIKAESKKAFASLFFITIIVVLLAGWLLYIFFHTSKDKTVISDMIRKERPANNILLSMGLMTIIISVLGICSYAWGVEDARIKSSASFIIISQEEKNSNQKMNDDMIRKIHNALSVDSPSGEEFDVDIILAENTDYYLISKGWIDKDRILHLDVNYQVAVEKKGQIILRKSVKSIDKEYTYIPD